MIASRAAVLAAVLVTAGCAVDPATTASVHESPWQLGFPATRVPTDYLEPVMRAAARDAGTYARVVVLAPTGAGDRERRRLAPLNAASGVVVGPGLVLTAAHIAMAAGHRARLTVDGITVGARVAQFAAQRELALLRADDPAALPPPARLRETPLTRGETVYAVGTPAGVPAVISAGRVRSRHSGPIHYAGFSYRDALVLDLVAEPGDSGGPVFDLAGHLVGMIASFTYDPASGAALGGTRARAYAIPATAIRDFLAQATRQGPLRRSPAGSRIRTPTVSGLRRAESERRAASHP